MTKDKVRGEYAVGDKVLVIIDPSQHKALPHRRYHGKVGTVKTVGRRTVKLAVNLGNKSKTLITRLDHIKPFGVA
jgi:large subunit ribosomal protein L21e